MPELISSVAESMKVIFEKWWQWRTVGPQKMWTWPISTAKVKKLCQSAFDEGRKAERKRFWNS